MAKKPLYGYLALLALSLFLFMLRMHFFSISFPGKIQAPLQMGSSEFPTAVNNGKLREANTERMANWKNINFSGLKFRKGALKDAMPVRVPIDYEDRLLNGVLMACLHSHPLNVTDPLLVGYLKKLSRTISSPVCWRCPPLNGGQDDQKDDAFAVFWKRDPNLNACASGTRVFVAHTSFLEAFETESVLKFAIAHELAHLLLGHTKSHRHMRHTQKDLDVMLSIGLKGLGLVFFPPLGIISDLHCWNVIEKDYAENRDLELEADSLGCRLLHETGSDPTEGLLFFTTLIMREPESAKFLEGCFRTHPCNVTRLARLKEIIQKFPGKYLKKRKSLLFWLAKARCHVLFPAFRNMTPEDLKHLFEHWIQSGLQEPEKSIGGYYGLALYYFHLRGDAERAAEYLEKALNGSQGHFWLLDLAVSLSIKRGKEIDLALEKLLQSKGSEDDNSLIAYLMGLHYVTLGRWKEAIDSFQSYLSGNPRDPNAWEKLAKSYEAAHLIAQMYSARGEQFGLKGSFKEAQLAFRKAISEAETSGQKGLVYAFQARLDHYLKLEEAQKNYLRTIFGDAEEVGPIQIT